MSSAKRIGEAAAAHLRHHQVGEKEIDRASSIFAEQTSRIIAVGRFDYVVTETSKHAHRNMANTNVVFENENGFGAATWFLTARFFIGWRWRRRHTRKINLNGGAFSQLAFNAQMPAALMDNPVTGGKTESASLLVGFGGEKRFEKMRLCLFTHSNSGIRHLDQNILARTKFAALKSGRCFCAKIGNRSLKC